MYVTNCFRNDGFGAQYQTIIYSAIYSEFIKAKFAYTPFKEMEHNYDNDLNFLKNKENFINIIENFPNADQLNDVKILNIHSIRGTIESNINTSIQTEIFKKIKKLFHHNKQQNFDKKVTNVAIHLRRINKHDNPDCYGTHYIDDNYYINAIDFLRKTPNKKIFHIYSQGDPTKFENFKQKDIVLHLNEPLEQTFYNLTVADILIMSKSSFSYVAALLSDNDVYYLPFWHPKLNRWKTF
jgi:hypothetical protein